jgi:hypothetical protein
MAYCLSPTYLLTARKAAIEIVRSMRARKAAVGLIWPRIWSRNLE